MTTAPTSHTTPATSAVSTGSRSAWRGLVARWVRGGPSASRLVTRCRRSPASTASGQGHDQVDRDRDQHGGPARAVLPSSTPISSIVTVATPTRLATSTSSTIAGTATRPLGAQ